MTSLILACLSVSVAMAPAQRDLKYRMVEFRSDRKGYWECSAKYPQFVGSSKFVREANAKIASGARKNVRAFVKMSKDDMETEKPRFPYYHEDDLIVTLARPDLISLYDQMEEYTGGAHPNHALIGSTCMRGPGSRYKDVRYQDLFKPGVDGLALTSPMIVDKLDMMGASWVLNGDMKTITKSEGEMFVLTQHGFTVLFSPYEAGSYAEGAYRVKILYSDLKGKLDPNGPLKNLLK